MVSNFIVVAVVLFSETIQIKLKLVCRLCRMPAAISGNPDAIVFCMEYT